MTVFNVLEKESNIFGKKIIEFKRIGGRWYLFIFLYFPITVGFAIFLNYLISGVMPEFGTLNELLAVPVLIILFLILNLFFGPLPEEIGWRGYGIDKCQEKWNTLNAALILGTFWAFWHLPVFYIEGTYQYELGAWTIQHKPIFVGVHPEYARRQDVEIQTRLVIPDQEIVYSLDDLAKQVIEFDDILHGDCRKA